MAFKIYTKTGDSGETGLWGGKRVSKSDLQIEAYGTLDELNAYLGLLKDSLASDKNICSELLQIQSVLFELGTILASSKVAQIEKVMIGEGDIKLLENAIDSMENVLPPLKTFILPGGHIVASHCHVARTICRRAERRSVALAKNSDFNYQIVVKYLNRLSDYLFVLARFIGFNNNASEIPWMPKK